MSDDFLGRITLDRDDSDDDYDYRMCRDCQISYSIDDLDMMDRCPRCAMQREKERQDDIDGE